MKTVKSIWTRPPGFFREGIEVCASLSIMTALRHCGNCTVYADKLGAAWLRALRLPLPLSDIVVALDDVPGDPRAWAKGKLWTYAYLAKRRVPFLHTDLDVFPWAGWSRRVMSGSVVAERAYWRLHDWAAGLSMSDHWRDAIARQDGIAFACGTYGGNDVDGLARIAKAGLDFLEDNQSALASESPLESCLLAEEWAIAREYDWNEVTTVLPPRPIGAQFASVASSYHHRLVSKRKPEGIAEMEVLLDAMLPGQSKRCKEVRKDFPAVVS